MSKNTLVYLDTEGFLHVDEFETEQEADEFVEEQVKNDELEWYHPTPVLIKDNSHTQKRYEGFEYD